MIVDAHHHLWNRARHDHGWLATPGLEAIDRDFTVADLATAVTSATTAAPGATDAVGTTVAVQALNSSAETHDLLAAAATLGALPIVLLFYSFQRFFVGGEVAGGVKE